MISAAENLLPGNGELYYYPSFIGTEVAEKYFHTLLEEINWKHEEITIYGKRVLQPRLTAWYGDVAYTYSGTTMHPIPFTPTLLAIKHEAEKISGAAFNSVLLNLYRDGHDYMGWHRDNEKELGDAPVIASVSFGAGRTFQVRKYKSKDEKLSVETANGSLLIMRGAMQHYWEHQLPKRLKVKDARINLTFRKITNG